MTKKSVIEWVKAGIYRTRDLAERIQNQWNKSVNRSSLRRLLRANRLRDKRIRKSCRHMRDTITYTFFRDELKALQAWVHTGEADLC